MNAETRWQDVKDAIRNIAWCAAGFGLTVMAIGGYLMSDLFAVAGLTIIAASPIFYLVSWAKFRPRHAKAIAADERQNRIAALERELDL